MDEYYSNMNKHTVIIPTAGLGSRLGDISQNLNKALLPFKGMPIIAHIIERFPKDTLFIIPVGYKSDQIKDFCKLVYFDRHIEFVEIDDYTSTKSGPGYTICKCLDFIDSEFWYIPCDTYINETLIDSLLVEDTVFVKKVPLESSSLYTMFEVIEDRVASMTFKKQQTSDWWAFTGVMYIHDWQYFKTRILSLKSPEIIWAITTGTKVIELNSWLDFGNLDIYKQSLAATQKYDFTKKDEFTYICNNRVVKWWSDVTIANKKCTKALTNPKVMPANCSYKGQWLAYNFFEGRTLYENHDLETLKYMLEWLDREVWLPSEKDLSNSAREFYKNKTLKRINLFLEKYPNIEDVATINGVRVNKWQYYLDKVDWDFLENTTLPGFIHGDLQFDNIIVNAAGEFKIIDWRHEFANLMDIGDIYYDLAKLTGGFIIDYSKIKQNEFTYNNENGNITLSIPHIKDWEDYIKLVKQFVENKGWDYTKVQLLIPIIFWNMSPLHTEPFDKFLWYLGIMLFEDVLSNN